MPTLKLHLGAGTAVQDGLARHRILIARHGSRQFVIANAADKHRALARAGQRHAEYEGVRRTYTILLTDEHILAVNAGVVLNVAVLDAQHGHVPFGPAIKVSNRNETTLRTEHGDFLGTITTTSTLRAGDVYTCGAFSVGQGRPGLIVYRALADYQPTNGTVPHHSVTRDWTPETGRRGAMTGGPDMLVYRIDRTAFLNHIGLADLTPASR